MGKKLLSLFAVIIALSWFFPGGLASISLCSGFDIWRSFSPSLVRFAQRRISETKRKRAFIPLALVRKVRRLYTETVYVVHPLSVLAGLDTT